MRGNFLIVVIGNKANTVKNNIQPRINRNKTAKAVYELKTASERKLVSAAEIYKFF